MQDRLRKGLPFHSGEMKKVSPSLFPLDNLSCANIGHGTMSPSQDRFDEKVSKHRRAEPNGSQENGVEPED